MTGRERPDVFDAPPPDRLMRVTVTPIGSAVVVEVVGELDLSTAPELMVSVDDALAQLGLTLVIIDLSLVEFLGSAGLGVLVNLATRAAGPGRPAVARRVVAPAVHRGGPPVGSHEHAADPAALPHHRGRAQRTDITSIRARPAARAMPGHRPSAASVAGPPGPPIGPCAGV